MVLAGCPSPLVPSDTGARDFDLQAPLDPAVSSSASSPYDTDGFVWSWTSGGGGSSVFRHRLNGAPWTIVRDEFSYDPPNLLPGDYLFEVQERDDAGNWSAAATFEKTIRVREPEVRLYPEAPGGSPEQTVTPDPADGPALPGTPAYFSTTQPGADWTMPIGQFGLTGTYTTRLQFREGDTWATISEASGIATNQWVAAEPLVDGRYRFGVAALSDGGAISLPTVATFVIDTAAPAAPTVTGLSIESVQTPSPTSFTVTADAGDTVSGYTWSLFASGDLGTALDSGTVTGDTIAVPLSTVSGGPGLGTYQLQVRQRDLAGNIGPAAAFNVDVEAIPAISVVGGSLTNDPTPDFNVVGNDPGNLVNNFEWVVDGSPNGETFPAGGAMDVGFVRTFAPGFGSDGSYEVQVRQERTDGSWTEPSPPVTVTVDTTPPAAPTQIQAPAALTNDPSPTIVFAGEPNGTFTFSLTGPSPSTESPVDGGDGQESFAPGPLSDGAYTLSVIVTDPAGNDSPPATTTFTLDATPPPAPTISGGPPDGSFVATGAVSYPLTFEAGATANFATSGASAVSGSEPDIGADGAESINLSGLNDGLNTIAFTVTDAAGNTSAPTSTTLTVDTVAPAAPTLVTGPGAATNDTTPSFTYAGESQAVYIFNLTGPTPDNLNITDTGDGQETFTTTALAEGAYTLTVTQGDPAGNLSPDATFGFTVDTTGPAAPTAVTGTDLQGAPPNEFTYNNSVTFTWNGSGEPGATWDWSTDNGMNWNGPVTTETVTVNSLALANDYSFVVRERDQAGNPGANSAPVIFDVLNSGDSTITITNPAAPVFSMDTGAFTLDVGGNSGPQQQVINVDTTETVSAYTWLVNGTEVATTASLTLDAGTQVPLAPPAPASMVFGSNTLTLVVTIGGQQYSDDFLFTVVDD